MPIAVHRRAHIRLLWSDLFKCKDLQRFFTDNFCRLFKINLCFDRNYEYIMVSRLPCCYKCLIDQFVVISKFVCGLIPSVKSSHSYSSYVYETFARSSIRMAFVFTSLFAHCFITPVRLMEVRYICIILVITVNDLRIYFIKYLFQDLPVL